MSSTKVLRSGADAGELAALLAQLGKEKGRLERLLSRVEDVLHRAGKSAKARRTAEPAAKVSPPRSSPLDDVKAVVASSADLREANGNLSAARIAKVFGTSLSQLADWLGRSKQAVSKTPDADSLQAELAYFERVARLRMMLDGNAEFRKWLRMPHELLQNKSPLDLMDKRRWQMVADYVEDALTGAPT